MKTQVLQSSDLNPAVLALKRGELVAFPTETVYGLGAPVFQENAVKKIFEIKKRPADNPLIAHIARLDQALFLSERLDGLFYRLAEAFWPGPLTIVVERKKEVPPIVSANYPSIAIRMPMHLTALELITRLDEPLVAPSANLSGKPSPTRVQDVLEDLDGNIPYCIDGGSCLIGIESTVISLIHKQPTLLRPGKITKEILEEVLGQEIRVPQKGEPALSPGMKYRHYAPKARIRLVFKKDELKGNVLIPTAELLYMNLREMDRKDVEEIVVYCDEKVRKDAALMNRLLRAAGQIL